MKLSSKQIKIARKIADSYKVALNISFNYQVPRDIFTCIYDFYALNLLRNGIDESDYRELMQSTEFQGYQNPKEIEAQINVNQAYNKLCDYLKKQFMDLIYYQVARQFSHLRGFYEDYDPYILDNLMHDYFDQKQRKFIKKYLDYCEKNHISGRGQSKFQNGEKIINALHPERVFFIKLAKKVFESIINSGGYGGKNWADICEAYLMFLTSSTEEAIDHVFDFQHNTGSIFYKHPKYSILASDIKTILDNKRNAEYPMAYISHCSHSIQDACRYLMRLKYGVYQDQFKQVEKTSGQLIVDLNNNRISDMQVDYILDQILIKYGSVYIYHAIKNKKLTSKRAIKKYYLYLINNINKSNDYYFDKFIKGLIGKGFITDQKIILKGFQKIVKVLEFQDIQELFSLNKIKEDLTLKKQLIQIMKDNNELVKLFLIINVIQEDDLFEDIVKFVLEKDSSIVLTYFSYCTRAIQSKIINILIKENLFVYLDKLIENEKITDQLIIERIQMIKKLKYN